ncbi:hypothetical protein BXT86_00855 [candidate division WOR-3 bacterium 4484_100]|uniref:Uncharacterized protein n=1 Tax=candidate division WOR-3 bacterium 4484_100 TaxID=1936077 RepID=A0A1V4QGK6_UNCW3|nr:MAG: hypothetical protein BXT86_00855 [candidate division WOR-3 bacterium 4484_100]
MAWPSKNHLENLGEILVRLHWWLQPDTILTELPYDLEFVSKTDIERFADWCRSAVSKDELEQGRYNINKPLIKFFVEKNFPELNPEKQKEKVETLHQKLYILLKLPNYEKIILNTANVNKIIDLLNNIPGESHFEKTAKKIKIAVALKWLQDEELSKNLTKPTNDFIRRVGDFYGRAKKGEHITASEIGIYNPPEDDKKKIVDDFERKVELALMSASQEIKEAKGRYETEDEYGPFANIIEVIKRLEKYIEGKQDSDYDYIEHFKDIIFLVIILNYIQDPYIKITEEAKKLLKTILPIYTRYKEFKNI